MTTPLEYRNCNPPPHRIMITTFLASDDLRLRRHTHVFLPKVFSPLAKRHRRPSHAEDQRRRRRLRIRRHLPAELRLAVLHTDDSYELLEVLDSQAMGSSGQEHAQRDWCHEKWGRHDSGTRGIRVPQVCICLNVVLGKIFPRNTSHARTKQSRKPSFCQPSAR